MFHIAVEEVLRHEGGYVNDPNDPGGETKYGISKRSYPNTDIANLTKDAAKDIYFNDYWVPIHGSEIPAPLAIMTFDCAVNQGINFATGMLQQAVGADVDHVIGPQTLMKACACDQATALQTMYNMRLTRYQGNRQFLRYGKGWTNRLNAVMALAKQHLA